MRIDKMTLLNFRRFEKLEASFHPELNVIIGANGSGKTTLMDALAMPLRGFCHGMGAYAEPTIEPSDVRTVRQLVDGRELDQPQYQCSVHTFFEDTHPSRVNAVYYINGPESVLSFSDDAFSYARDLAANVMHLKPLPLVRSFSARRAWESRSLDGVPISKVGSRLDPYKGCLEIAPSQEELLKWLAHETYSYAQRFMRGDHSKSQPLEVINAALRTCMDGFKELYYAIDTDELKIVWEGERGEEPFARLSDGQRNIIAMIADLAWRASLLNPQFGAEAAAKTPGVVLIDELELHLHPAWQRRIVRDLRAAFPLVQFFGTTHSPQIISEVPRECLLILHEDGTISGPEGFIEGRDSNAILRDVMGVSERPDGMVARIVEALALIDQERYDEARKSVESLKETLGPDDDEVRLAEMRLRMEAP